MIIKKVTINNFRGIHNLVCYFEKNNLITGDNNAGKSTVLEAIDLVLGPQRMSRSPIIDEHDFYAGEYLINGEATHIQIDIMLADLSVEEVAKYRNFIEYYDKEKDVTSFEALESFNGEVVFRVSFRGFYDVEEDDFNGFTYFTRSYEDDGKYSSLSKKFKNDIGYLYLRTVRTGNRALSLEHGSLLDVILRVYEIRPQMWEALISEISKVDVANKEELKIKEIMQKLHLSIKSVVPNNLEITPSMFVSNLTREHLRTLMTVFMDSGVNKSDGSRYLTPYYHLGSGTVNAVVLALLRLMAEVKNNVIFAMEEPEISLPPYAQKRIIGSLQSITNQAIFTTHSPYVLEEFETKQIIHLMRLPTSTEAKPIGRYPGKPKDYRDDMRRRFSEALLSDKVLIVEGKTEQQVYQSLSRRLEDELQETWALEGLGVSIFNAESETNIPGFCRYFRRLGKKVCVVCDNQSETNRTAILDTEPGQFLELSEKGIEDSVVDNLLDTNALLKFLSKEFEAGMGWRPKWGEHPENLADDTEALKVAAKNCFVDNKTNYLLAEFICSLPLEKIPGPIMKTMKSIKDYYYEEVSFSVGNCDD
jgi:putative ATP-dependent endonuclease of OLD family